jgi:hypothetical protein
MVADLMIAHRPGYAISSAAKAHSAASAAEKNDRGKDHPETFSAVSKHRSRAVAE